MLEFIRGRLESVNDSGIVINVGGVGLRIRVAATKPYMPNVGKTITVHLFLDIQPRRWTIYGFRAKTERDLFEGLIGIPGIGASSGLKLLPHIDDLRRGRTEEMPRLAGVGPAKQRRVLEWLERDTGRADAGRAGGGELANDLRAALENLGLRPEDARARAARAMSAKRGAGIEELLRLAVSGKDKRKLR